MSTAVRTRIAPAPSGSIHVGNARTALYNWLFARGRGGTFVLRIEDTDATRVSDAHIEGVLEDLRWLGLEWDEGPEIGGPHAPYRQSERRDAHRARAEWLLAEGWAYRDYLTTEEHEELRRRAQATREPWRFSEWVRERNESRGDEYAADARPYTIRFRVPEGRTVSFDDVGRGSVVTDTRNIADFILLRSDGTATYNLAVTIDDVEMDITHIIRGEDLMASTPRQLLLRDAMGVADVPVFAHLPLLVDSSGRPLSKRWGDVSVRNYRERGFLPEALVNYLALLGWSYDDRTNIFSLHELIQKFSLERVGRNPAAFDVAKLEWLNGHYIRARSPGDLAADLVPFCERAGFEVTSPDARVRLDAVTPLLVERLKRLDEAPEMIRFLFEEDVTPDDKARKVLDGRADYLSEVVDVLDAVEEWRTETIEEALRRLAERLELKPKKAFQPIRAAVTGTLVSPPLFESLEILGRERTLIRLRVSV
jgi:glutamyl-tRNA synthetase